MITFEQLGIILNATGLVVPLVGSLAISWQYRFPFFRYWTLAYVAMAATLPILLLLEAHGRPLSLTYVVIFVYLLHVDLLARSGASLQGQALGRRWNVFALGALAAVNVLLALSQSYLAVAAAITLMSLVSHAYLGVVLWRIPGEQALGIRRWLGAMVVGMGVWGITYPLLPAQAIWIGYAIAGLLHLLVGVGMIVLLLAVVSAELDAQNQELEKLDALKSHFIATVSHDLRTPLTIVKGAAGLLKEQTVGPLDGEQIRLVQGLASHADRLTNLVSDLLDFSRIEVGETRYRLEATALGPLLGAVVAEARPAFEEKGLTLRLEATAGARPARIDRMRLAQVVEALLSNALKFTPAPGVVTVTLHEAEDALIVTVHDTGRGIPEALLEQIFARFYQVDNSTTREADGLGLGLAICRAIVEEGHGGRIWAESAPGAGTSFHIHLPAAAAAVPAPMRAS